MWCPSVQTATPQNENCQRGWDFSFDLVQSTPPPPIEKFGQDLGLSVLSCQELPLTQQEHGGNECVETNCCILHGYRLIITGFRLNYGRYFGKESRL